MKAIVIHQYGNPEVMQYEDHTDPVAGPGQLLIRVAATSINPVDVGRRSGKMKKMFPIQFPGIIGVDVSGTVAQTGPGVAGFSTGDKVFAFADQTYAELCVVPANTAVKVPAGLDLIDAAALPLIVTTANMLITQGTAIKAGQTVLIAGAAGSVGRAAVYTAKKMGAVVIAGVLRRQLEQAKSLGADQVVATDDESALASLPQVDAVADAVGGKTAAILMGKVINGGVFASVLGPPTNAKDYPTVRVVPVFAKPDAKILAEMAQAVVDGKLDIPISRKLPLRQAAEAHAAVEKGGIGKVLLTV